MTLVGLVAGSSGGAVESTLLRRAGMVAESTTS